MLERGPPTAVGRRGQPDRTFVRPITTMWLTTISSIFRI